MVILIVNILALLITGAWKRWKEFYPTILYAIIGDLSYNFLFFNYRLWEYKTLFNPTFADMFYAFLVFPSTVILFLSFYPSGYMKVVLYILIWTVGLSAIEYIAILFGNFSHYNGWNMFLSAGLYFIAFILIKLHAKHPLIVWLISLGFALLTMLIFGQPILG